jgi:hypothetical protein
VAQARLHLDQARITNPSRDRISTEKQSRLEDALQQAFFRHCTQPGCLAAARHSGLTPLVVRKDACQSCGGSNQRHAVEGMLSALKAAGIRSVCVVGGSPALREELDALISGEVKLLLIDGTQTPDQDRARAHVRGHDVVVVCGGSQLSHKLSNTYGAWKEEGHVVTAARRGLEAVAEALTIHARARAARPAR